MPKLLNRLGIRYGRLTVIEHAGKDYRGKHQWLCRCDCGNEKIVVSDNLSSGKSRSCGCLRLERLEKLKFKRHKNRVLVILRKQYSVIKKRHKKFDDKIISFKKFKELVLAKCKYCGIEYSKELYDTARDTKLKVLLSNTIIKCNGIDRLDHNVGYTDENSVPCCTRCNWSKHIMNEEDFYSWIRKVYEYSAKLQKTS